MPFEPVILWTDALVFLLLVAVAAFTLYVIRRDHLREAWRRVLRRRLGLASAMVLAVYVLVGLLDTVHFRLPLPDAESASQTHYSVEVLSLLDVIMGPIRMGVEKTYSAPFATHLYTKETVELPNGTQGQVYPRLQHGGAHLQDPERDRFGDIAWRAAGAARDAFIAWTLLTVVVAYGVARRSDVEMRGALMRIAREETVIPWRVALLTAGVLILFMALVAHLGLTYHIFGTDEVGQDVLYQSVKSIRTGLVIGTLTTLVMLPFAVMLGIMAGYFRGWVDDVIQYLYTTLNSIPAVLLIAAAILSLQVYMANHPELFDTVAARADLRLLFLCIVLGITSWTGLARLLRGETLKLREMPYVEAAVALGTGHLKLVTRHILPNVMHIVLIIVVLDFSSLVLAEAVLSYVGVGVDPTMNSWGNMINRARLEMAREPIVWWSLSAAFLFMFVLVLAANLFADAVRDAFDPKVRQEI